MSENNNEIEDNRQTWEPSLKTKPFAKESEWPKDHTEVPVPAIHPHHVLVSYLPHLHAVVKEQRLKEKVDREHQERDDKVEKMDIFYRFYYKFLLKKYNSIMDDDGTVPYHVKENLPLYWSRLVSLLAKLAFLAIVIVLTIINYNDDVKSVYISLDNGVSDKNSENYDELSSYRQCDTVAYNITQNFAIDVNGYWSSKGGFSPGLDKLRVQFSSFKAEDEAVYEAFMKRINSTIAANVSYGAASRPTAMNLLYSMAWTAAINDHLKVSFTGDPAYVFNRVFKTAALGSAGMQCYTVPTIFYERSGGIFDVKFLAGSPTFTGQSSKSAGSGFLADSSTTGCCSPSVSKYQFDQQTDCIINPLYFGYNTMYDATYLSFKYNIWTVNVALAVNLGILDYSYLVAVKTDMQNSHKGCYRLNGKCGDMTAAGGVCAQSPAQLTYHSSSKACSITANNVQYYVEARMYDRYPGMDPVYCLVAEPQNATTTVGCFVRLGESFTLPFMNHMGASTSKEDFYNWKYSCDCSAPDFSSLPTQLKAFYTSNSHSTRGDFVGSFWSKFYGGGVDASGYCQQYDLIHGLVMMNSNYQDAILKHFLLNVVQKYAPAQINSMATIAGFSALRVGGNAGTQLQASLNIPATSFSNLITATFASSSNQVVYVGPAITYFEVGNSVSGSGIVQGTTISAIQGTTLTLSNPSQSAQTSVVLTVVSKWIPRGSYLFATFPLEGPSPQTGWYVSIKGNPGTNSIGLGTFIREIKEIGMNSVPYNLQFTLSGDVKFTTGVNLIASPIKLGNTQLSDHKQVLGITDSVSITLHQSLKSSTDFTQAGNALFFSARSITTVADLRQNEVMSLDCSCTLDVTFAAALNTNSYIITSTAAIDSKIKAGDTITGTGIPSDTVVTAVAGSSLIMSNKPKENSYTKLCAAVSTSKVITYPGVAEEGIRVGAFVTGGGFSNSTQVMRISEGANIQTLYLSEPSSSTASVQLGFSAGSVTVSTKCTSPIASRAPIKSISTQNVVEITFSVTKGSYVINIGSSNPKIAVGSVISPSVSSNAAIPSNTYVTSISANKLTLSAGVTEDKTNAKWTFTTAIIEVGQAAATFPSTTVGSLECAVSYGTNAYSFCSDLESSGDDAGNSCVVLAMQTFDTYDQRINEMGTVPSTSMSCNDDFSMSAEAWDNIYETTPTSLIEAFYECYPTVFSSLNYGFGIASGYASSVTPFMVVIIIFWATRIAIPSYKTVKKRVSTKKVHSSGSSINFEEGQNMQTLEVGESLGDADGDGLVDEEELNGFGKVLTDKKRTGI